MIVAAAVAAVPAAVITVLGFFELAGRPADAQTTGADSDVLALGEELYSQHCASCHGFEGQGGFDGQVPPLVGVGEAATDFMLRTGRMPAQNIQNLSYSLESVKFDDEQTEAIVAYVSTLGPGGPGIPTIDVEAGDINEGRDLFINNCAACHGPVGQGDAVTGGAYAPNLHRIEALQIGEAIRFGPGPMPSFDEETFDEGQLDSIVRYVNDFKDLDNPGGWALGYGGPVAEGAFTFAVGLVLMIVVVRRIGFRYGKEPDAPDDAEPLERLEEVEK